LGDVFGMLRAGRLAVILALSLAAPAVAAAAPRPFTPDEQTAYGQARAIMERMPRGAGRTNAAYYLSYRLLHRGFCQEALPILDRELIDLDKAKPLALLGMRAALARQPRCVAWSAKRLEAVAESPAMTKADRAIARFHAATLLGLSGRTDLGASIAVEEEALDFVPEDRRSATLVVDGLSINVGFANPPRMRQLLLIERLSLYRFTPLHLQLARSLATRAKVQPGFFNQTGWAEVALALLEDGDSDGARQLLADGKVVMVTLEGLEAEAALRRGDHDEAARKLAGSDWQTRDTSVVTLGERAPRSLLPWIDDDAFWGDRNAPLHLAMFVESLDRHGDSAAAEHAARAALRFFPNELRAYNREALMRSRVGDMEGARAVLATALRDRFVNQVLVSVGVATGMAIRGDAKGALEIIGEVPARHRGYALVKLRIASVAAPDAVRRQIESALIRYLKRQGRTPVSASTFVSLARVGVSANLLAVMTRYQLKPADPARLSISVAWAAAEAGHSELARQLADRAMKVAPRRDGRDRHFVALAHIYAGLGDVVAATRTARRVANRAMKVDALTRFMEPPALNLVPKFSFETF
jgi:Flp pilus assembly protein TadD